MSRIHFFSVTLIAAVVVACACSPAKRPADEPDAAATDTDTDTDTGLVWIPGDDFDLTEPFLLHEYKVHRRQYPSFSFDGENLAISWSDGLADISDDYHSFFIFVFPWDMPWNASLGTFLKTPPAFCHSMIPGNTPSTKPFPSQDGFFVITTGITVIHFGNEEHGCQVVLSEWDMGASLTYEPHEYFNLYPDEHINAMSPTGPQDSAGCVTAGNIKCTDCGPIDDHSIAQLVYQVYRYCPGDPPQLVLGQNYPWSDQVNE